ncbi:MAG: glycosyl hydrolase [Ilumatobacteraceae bacterium]|nr:glycosyl hydrolase [Ilumatobacteraceae bacterium]
MIVLVGTTKGLFTLRSGDGRERFEVTGPAFAGEEVYATCIDARSGATRLFAGSVSNHWGPVLRRSDDLGASWTEGERAALRFPEGADASVARIWQLAPGPVDEPDVIYAGVEPAALFRSDDGGRSFSLVHGLWDHPHRTQWQPGGGGLCLHTVLVHPEDPDRLLIAISAAGVYRSEDGGSSWQASNRGIVVGFVPEGEALEFGQCVHKVARDAGDPERLYLQHHGGIYRSDDGGGAWTPMTGIAGMDFGFPVVAHPTQPSTAYLLPLESDEYRCTPNGRCTVWRTTDAGASWEPLTTGLPQRDAHITVLRDGFTTDGQDPAGLYLGTRTGEVYASIDDGDSWRLLAEHLPPVMSVRAAAIVA